LSFLLCSYGFICFNPFILPVLAWILSMRIVGFLSELRLLRGHRRIPTLFGLTRGVAVPLFFYKTALSMSENSSMVVKNLWQPCTLLCFPGILDWRILFSYSRFSGQANMSIVW
jgi:hypothetical protein